MENYQSKKFSIGDAAKITGASHKQIRLWEERGYIPKAMRIICGKRAYRYFSNEDIRTIKTIKQYLDEGFTLKAAAKKAADAQ